MTFAQPIPLKDVFWVFVGFLAASIVSHQSGLDLWLARYLYTLEGGPHGGFPWNHNYWLYQVLHEGGRALVKRLYFIILGLFLCSWFIPKLRIYRQKLLFIALTTLIATSLISALKHTTTIPCPKSLIEFGGERQWINIWQAFSSNLPTGSCYPAGHSSSGYAWLCLAYLFPYGSKSFYWSLLPGTGLGFCFGVAQQLRGAHFLSHDLLTIALCWLISGILFYAFHWHGKLKGYPSGSQGENSQIVEVQTD